MRKKKIIKKINSNFILNKSLFLFKKKYLFFICLYENFFFGKSLEKKLNNYIHLDFENNNASLWNNSVSIKKNKFKTLKKFFFFSNFFFFFKKFKFKGKGFKIKKTKKKKFKFYFGHSHFVYFFCKSIISKKLNKYKHVFLTNNYKKLKKISNLWLKIKPLSWYTKRGLRSSKQQIQRREGKKSTY